MKYLKNENIVVSESVCFDAKYRLTDKENVE